MVSLESREILKMLWSDMEPLSPGIVQQFLSGEQFSNVLVQALQNTQKNTPQIDSPLLIGKEYGFFGYRYIGLMDKAIHLGVLIEGEDGRLSGSSIQSFIDQHDAGRALSFVLHTHPRRIGTEKLMQAVFGGHKHLPQVLDWELGFSEQDLKAFVQLSRQEDSSIIEGIAIPDLDGITSRLLLISFNSFISYINFDPGVFDKKAKKYAFLGKSHLDVYRKFGLNVAELTVNLETKPPLDEKEIEMASLILTSRSHSRRLTSATARVFTPGA